MDEISSPLTGSLNTALITTYNASKLIDDWKSYFNIDISNELRAVNVISLYRCIDTQLEFFLPASVIGSDNLYAELQKFDWFYMADKWEFNTAIKDMAHCKKILEVGCGSGYFIEKVIKTLDQCIVKGIDFSDEAIQKALKKNLPVECTDLQKFIAKGETFDAICSFQVLEHIFKPYEFLSSMVQALEPGGQLILSVPNKESFLKYQYNLLDMPPHHMTKWNAYTFSSLEKLLPLKLVRVSFEPLTDYHISGYVDAYVNHICNTFKVFSRITTELHKNKIAAFIKKSGLFRYLRGQTLYVLCQKI